MLRVLLLASLVACGLGAVTTRQRPRLYSRTVGGVPVNIEDFPYQFRAGSSIRGSDGTLHPAAQIISHPLNDYSNFDFNVAVVRVSVPFTYEPGVQPIPLTSSESLAGSPSVVSGWGILNYSDPTLPSQLQAVEVYITPHDACESDYAAYGGITENMISAGVPGGGKDFCSHDDGGPLVVDGQLVAIVSWGIGCALSYFPGVYSNVAALKSFITQETGVQ